MHVKFRALQADLRILTAQHSSARMPHHSGVTKVCVEEGQSTHELCPPLYMCLGYVWNPSTPCPEIYSFTREHRTEFADKNICPATPFLLNHIFKQSSHQAPNTKLSYPIKLNSCQLQLNVWNLVKNKDYDLSEKWMHL
eukprot:631611-Amphidinium_carterae.1